KPAVSNSSSSESFSLTVREFASELVPKMASPTSCFSSHRQCFTKREGDGESLFPEWGARLIRLMRKWLSRAILNTSDKTTFCDECPLLGVKRTAIAMRNGLSRCRFEPVRCPVLSLGGGNETARVHHNDRRRDGVAPRCARVAEDSPHRLVA